MLVAGFGSLGTIVGIYAESFDHTSFINNIVILPLTFLGRRLLLGRPPRLTLGAGLPR